MTAAKVDEGDIIGRIVDPQNPGIAVDIISPERGLLICTANNPFVHAGTPVGHLLPINRGVKTVKRKLDAHNRLIVSGSQGDPAWREEAEVDEIFFIRLSLEPTCAASAIGIARDELDAMEARVMALMREGPGDEGRAWDTDNDFHQMIALAAGNRATAKVIANLHRRTAIFDHTQVPARFLKGCAEHLDILDALRDQDGPRAEKAMRAHLEGARDAIFRRLQTLNADRADAT